MMGKLRVSTAGGQKGPACPPVPHSIVPSPAAGCGSHTSAAACRTGIPGMHYPSGACSAARGADGHSFQCSHPAARGPASICSLCRLLVVASPHNNLATSPTLPSASVRQTFVLPQNIWLIKMMIRSTHTERKVIPRACPDSPYFILLCLPGNELRAQQALQGLLEGSTTPQPNPTGYPQLQSRASTTVALGRVSTMLSCRLQILICTR